MMLQVISRGDFLSLVGVKSSTLDQRVLTGEAAFALGCHKPAHTGEYLVLDGIAMLLGSMLNRFAGLELKAAADAVRQRWDDWLTLVTKAERFPISDDSQLFFAVAWLSKLGCALTPRVVMGEPHEIAAALAGERVYTVNYISISLLLHHLRDNAKRAKVALPPERLTIAPDEPGYENWRAEIRAYQERAEARFQAKTKAKAKGRRAARAAARKLLKA